MNFQLSEDQEALAAGIRALCEGRFPIEKLRTAEGADRVMDSATWRELGEAGVFALTLPEQAGGVGLGLSDAAVVYEELGRALIPGPLVGTFLAANLVAGAGEGRRQVGLVERPSPGAPALGRMPILVEHLGALDDLLILPQVAEGTEPPTLADLGKLRATAERIDRPLDPLTPLWHVADLLESGPVTHTALPDAAGVEPSEALRHRGMLVTGAFQIGIAARCVELAVAYAQQRQQFGRPIGSFQAIKHICADMLVRAETARCAVHAAATLADQPEAARVEGESSDARPDEVLVRTAAGAKLLADEAAIGNARACIQVHGGMGFTWEVPIHLYLKRACVLATTFGTAHQLAETVAALL